MIEWFNKKIEWLKGLSVCGMLKIKMYRYKIIGVTCDGEFEIELKEFTDESINRVLKKRVYSDCGCYITINGVRYYKNQIESIEYEILESKDFYVFDIELDNLFYRNKTDLEIDENNKGLKEHIEIAAKYNKIEEILDWDFKYNG